MGTDEEGHGGETVGLHGLDGEEQVVGGSAFEIVHGCVRRIVPTATSGTEAKA